MDGSTGGQDNQNKDTKQNPPLHTGAQNANQSKPGLSWTPSQNSSGATPPKVQQKTSGEVPGTDSTSRTIGIIVGIIVVFVLVAWGIASVNKHAPVSEEGATASSTDMTTTDGDTQASTGSTNSSTTVTPVKVATSGSTTFTVTSPQDAGAEVAVDALSLTDPTWIIVYESADGTSAGNILGAGLFFPGDTTGKIELLRPTTSGKTYLVSAAVDSGDKVFVKADEKYVTDASGGVLYTKFQTN